MSDQRGVGTAGAADVAARNGPAGPLPAPPRQAAPTRSGAASPRRKWLLLAALAVAGVAAYLGWTWLQPAKLPAGFASSNGRIEGTEIDVAAKLAGRIIDELVDEGDVVTAGQVVAHMEIDVLQAQRREAVARLGVAKSAVETARSTLEQRQSEKAAAEAVVLQREAELDVANRYFERAQKLVGTEALSREEYDTRRGAYYDAKAVLSSARAKVAAENAAISTAKALIVGAEATVAEAQATI
jgi:HlyD family secretion protein